MHIFCKCYNEHLCNAGECLTCAGCPWRGNADPFGLCTRSTRSWPAANPSIVVMVIDGVERALLRASLFSIRSRQSVTSFISAKRPREH